MNEEATTRVTTGDAGSESHRHVVELLEAWVEGMVERIYAGKQVTVTGADDSEFVKAVREWVKAAEECGVGWYWKRPGTARHRQYRSTFAKVKSLLPADKAKPVHTVTYPQCRECASRKTTFHEGLGWLCDQCAPVVTEFMRGKKPDLREAAEKAAADYPNEETVEWMNAPMGPLPKKPDLREAAKRVVRDRLPIMLQRDKEQYGDGHYGHSEEIWYAPPGDPSPDERYAGKCVACLGLRHLLFGEEDDGLYFVTVEKALEST